MRKILIALETEKVDRLITVLNTYCQADPDTKEIAEDIVHQQELQLTGEDFRSPTAKGKPRTDRIQEITIRELENGIIRRLYGK